jgi:ABC-type multidrug transport system fused ATPase/permease subunit
MMVNLGIPEGTYEIIVLLAAAFLAILLRSVMNYVRDLQTVNLKFKVAKNLRQRAVESFVQADFAFLSSKDKGNLFSFLTLEVDRAADALSSRVVFMTAMTLFSIYTLLLFVISPILAIYVSPILTIVGLILKRQSRTAYNLSQRVSSRNTAFGQQINDCLNGITRIKMRGQERKSIAQVNEIVKEITANLLGVEKLRILTEGGTFPLLTLATTSTLFIALEVLDMSLASLSLFMLIIVRLTHQVNKMNTFWAPMHGYMTSYQNLKAIIEEADAHREVVSGRRHFHRIKTGIDFQDVSFIYPGSQATNYAIRRLSHTIQRGSLIALVGRSGAGKSTLVNLLTRFYIPQEGHILLDGRPVTEFNLRSLRRKMAFVPQEPYFFNNTIFANLVYGLNHSPTPSQLEEILIQGNCAEFIRRQEKGLLSEVGERGIRLSQGQRQRLAIAHALAVKPEILILDEPTSALDSESEQAIQETLNRYHGRLTIIVIAHRLSTIRHADEILVIDHGCLVASGGHEALLEVSPLYRTLFEVQLNA